MSDSKQRQPEHMLMKVVNAKGCPTFFKVKKTSKLETLMDAYAEHAGQVRNSIQFTFHGIVLKPDDRPVDLYTSNNDVPAITAISLATVEQQQPKWITVKVVNVKGDEVSFLINSRSKLEPLMDAYAERADQVRNSIQFKFNGVELNPDDRIADLAMSSDHVVISAIHPVTLYIL